MKTPPLNKCPACEDSVVKLKSTGAFACLCGVSGPCCNTVYDAAVAWNALTAAPEKPRLTMDMIMGHVMTVMMLVDRYGISDSDRVAPAVEKMRDALRAAGVEVVE